MSRLKPRNAAAYLRHPAFQALRSEWRRLASLTGALRSQLPEPLASHCRVVRAQGRQVSIAVDASAWLSKARFMLPALEQGLAPALGGKPHIRLLVVPPAVAAPRGNGGRKGQATGRRPLSRRSAAYLRDYAQSLEPSALQDALLRLAGRANGQDD